MTQPLLLERLLRESASHLATSREQRVKRTGQENVLVTGGAGFIGSNLCDRLIAEGAHVICIDNLQTGRAGNLKHLDRESRFEFIEHDVIDEWPTSMRADRMGLTHIFHLA